MTTVNVKENMGQKLGSLATVIAVVLLAIQTPTQAAGPETGPRREGAPPVSTAQPPLLLTSAVGAPPALTEPILSAATSSAPAPAPALEPAGPGREWELVAGKHWQIKGPRGEDPAVTDAREGTRGSCPTGMVDVQGKMKQHFLLDDLQLQACTKWIDHKWPERCAEYDRDRWLALAKDLPTQDIHVCMDRFEYPNRKGEWPIIMVSWYEARDACKADNKRLCTEDEWTYACEGDEASPYPSGYSREASECVNDRPWKKFDDQALMPRTTPRAMAELDRLWQGEPSGARASCKSKAGVYDMTGNIDEWTRSSIASERPSVLKGGYWGPVRTRCRPATKAHDESHTFYQQGFRCCADPARP